MQIIHSQYLVVTVPVQDNVVLCRFHHTPVFVSFQFIVKRREVTQLRLHVVTSTSMRCRSTASEMT